MSPGTSRTWRGRTGGAEGPAWGRFLRGPEGGGGGAAAGTIPPPRRAPNRSHLSSSACCPSGGRRWRGASSRNV